MSLPPTTGYRSVDKDLESQIVLMTDDVMLQHKLQQERNNIFTSASRADDSTLALPERQLPWWLTPFTNNVVAYL